VGADEHGIIIVWYVYNAASAQRIQNFAHFLVLQNTIITTTYQKEKKQKDALLAMN